MRKTKRAAALEITRDVKRIVSARDGYRCIICGALGLPNAHFISRSHGGLGIEENIVTLCYSCHMRFDQSTERESLRRIIAEYLRDHYPGWDPENLVYRKE